MDIGGILPQSLNDYPGKISCVLFCQGCNLRCGFCHNPELVFKKSRKLSENRIINFIKERKGFLDGVVLSGGEPTCQIELPKFIERIKNENFLVKLDTNGTNPSMLKDLLNKKLIDCVAVDVKTSSDKYDLLTRSGHQWSKVRESIDLLREFNVKHELRTTVVPGFFDDRDKENMARMVEGSKQYMLQTFSPSKTLDKRFAALEVPSHKFMDDSVKYFSGICNCGVR